jgi:triacylglycerol lipase
MHTPMGRKLDDTLAVLNGLVGDYLVRTDNALATEMALYHDERPLPLTEQALRSACGKLTGKVVVLVHGMMCTETVWRMPDGSDCGSRLATDLGFTPLYVRYNSGLPIADNGASLHELLAQLVSVYPVRIEELLLMGYSMGGLVLRSACHRATQAQASWLPLVRRAIYVGTPHAGAPAERAGRIVARVLNAIPDPYTKLIAEIGNLRSAGVKDLGDADLRSEDRADQAQRVSLRDARHPVPLLPSIRHYLIAGSLSEDPNLSAWFGDSIVPVTSAMAQRMRDSQGVAIQATDTKILEGRTHLQLPADPEAYEQIKLWCKETT